MGFWTDKDKKEEESFQSPNDSFQNSQFFQDSFETYRECKKDKEDPQYLLCKDVKQKINDDGKYERQEGQEQRVPVSEFYSSMSNPFQSITPIFGSLFSNINNFMKEGAGFEKDINDFYNQFKSSFQENQRDNSSFFNGSNDDQRKGDNENNSFKHFSSFSSSSSSRSCTQDKNDKNYLICTTKITKRTPDGKKAEEVKEERIPVNGNSQNFSNDFSNLFQSPLFFGSMIPKNQEDIQNHHSPTNGQREEYSNKPKQQNQQRGQYSYPQYEKKRKDGRSEIHDL